MPLVIDIGYTGLQVNYTLTDAPTIKNNALIYSSYAIIINRNNPNLNPPIPPPKQLPDF